MEGLNIFSSKYHKVKFTLKVNIHVLESGPARQAAWGVQRATNTQLQLDMDALDSEWRRFDCGKHAFV